MEQSRVGVARKLLILWCQGRNRIAAASLVRAALCKHKRRHSTFILVQLLSARLPIQISTAHNLKLECRRMRETGKLQRTFNLRERRDLLPRGANEQSADGHAASTTAREVVGWMKNAPALY